MRKLVSLVAVVVLATALTLSAVAFGATKRVGVSGLKFKPATVSIKKGDTVRWSWKTGGVPHNVTGKGFKSGNETSGKFKHTFKQVGTYKYTCTLHQPDMDGVVKVTR